VHCDIFQDDETAFRFWVSIQNIQRVVNEIVIGNVTVPVDTFIPDDPVAFRFFLKEPMVDVL
jgi:hypothetical protein